MTNTKEVLRATASLRNYAKNRLNESISNLIKAQKNTKPKIAKQMGYAKRSLKKTINESANSNMLLEYLNNYALLYFDDTMYNGDGPIIAGLTAKELGANWSIENRILTLYVTFENIDWQPEEDSQEYFEIGKCNMYFPIVEGYEEVSLDNISEIHCLLYNQDDEREMGELKIVVWAADDIDAEDAVEEVDAANEYGQTNIGYPNVEFAKQFVSLCSECLNESKKTIKKNPKLNRVQESVASRFARYRRMYENLNEAEDEDDKNSDDADAFSFDDIDTSSDNADDSDDKKGDDEANEDVPMTAVVITVAKDDAEKCKDEMVDSGIDEDDIEILDSDDDDDTTEIKIDANSVMALKDYLKGKGIDLEEKIGGEIVDDSDEDDDKKDDDKEKGSDSEDDDLGDFTEDDLDDLFADDADTEDSK